MPIPPAKRVTFTPNPLVEVVTQFAFPRLPTQGAEGESGGVPPWLAAAAPAWRPPAALNPSSVGVV